MEFPSDDKEVTMKGNVGSRGKKSLGKLGGPGSDVDPGLNDGSNPSLLDLLRKEDAKAARANANLQERLNDVANLEDQHQGGYADSDNTDDSDQQE